MPLSFLVSGTDKISFGCNRFLPYIGYVTIAMVCPMSQILTRGFLTRACYRMIFRSSSTHY